MATDVDGSSSATTDTARDARLSSRRVRLRPLLPSDYPFLYAEELSERLAVRWRHRGATPSPDVHAAGLWAGVLVQYLIEPADGGEPVGMMSCFDPDFAGGHAQIAAAAFGREQRIHVAEASVLFVDHVFSCWDFHKLYLDTPGYNLSQVRSRLLDILHEEGRLKDHVFKFGRRWDLHILSLYRDQWWAMGLGERLR